MGMSNCALDVCVPLDVWLDTRLVAGTHPLTHTHTHTHTLYVA